MHRCTRKLSFFLVAVFVCARSLAGATGSAQARLNATLCDALENGQYVRMVVLLERGADPNAKTNNDGRTLLMQAAGWGVDDTIRLLVKSGARINAQDADGKTALMYAVNKGRDDNARALLTCHADVRLHDKAGATAIEMAKESLACNAITPFLHIEAGKRRKFWQQMVRILKFTVRSS